MSLKNSMLIIHSILASARVEILKKVTDTEIFPLRNRIIMELERNINSLAVNAGIATLDNAAEVITGKPQPLTRMFGKEIKRVPDNAPVKEMQVLEEKPAQQSVVLKTAQEVEAEELKAKVLELYPVFLTIEDDAILDTYSELEIRAIGKTAGLPVTETNPKKVDAKFVTQIKDAIRKKNEIEAKGNS